MSRGNFSLFFRPNLRGAFCLRFSRKMAVFALFCVGQSGADAQLGSQAIVCETRPTHNSPPHFQILCNAQVAYRMVPRDARSCLTCSMICPRTTKTLMILSPSSTPTSRRLFRKCVVRPPLTRSAKALNPPYPLSTLFSHTGTRATACKIQRRFISVETEVLIA